MCFCAFRLVPILADDAGTERRHSGSTESNGDAMEMGTLVECHTMTFTYPDEGEP